MGAPAPIAEPATQSVVLFDGVCNLCNGAVRFIIARDPGNKFRFASLQSEAAAKILGPFHLNNIHLYSILLIKDGKVYDRSDAILEIASQLSGPWKVFGFFKIIPRTVRDIVYNLVARSRYRLFGRKDVCMIPSPEIKVRFLE